MKYIFIISSICLISLVGGDVFAGTYKQAIPNVENPQNPNTQSNISRAELLETHVHNFQKNIGNIAQKYDIVNNEVIQNTLLLVAKMYDSVQKIQTFEIEKNDADEVIHSIVEDLSILNTGIKAHFKIEIEKINTVHQRYGEGAKKIASHLDILNDKLEKRVYSKSNLDSRDKQILVHIKKLKKISQNLKNFGDIEFYKISEMRSSLLRLVKDIKAEINNIRQLD